MDITSRNEDKALVVSVNGRMDAVTASDFEKALTEFLDQGNISLVIDFTDLDYISSAGLRSILATAKKMKGMGVRHPTLMLPQRLVAVSDLG